MAEPPAVRTSLVAQFQRHQMGIAQIGGFPSQSQSGPGDPGGIHALIGFVTRRRAGYVAVQPPRSREFGDFCDKEEKGVLGQFQSGEIPRSAGVRLGPEGEKYSFPPEPPPEKSLHQDHQVSTNDYEDDEDGDTPISTGSQAIEMVDLESKPESQSLKKTLMEGVSKLWTSPVKSSPPGGNL